MTLAAIIGPPWRVIDPPSAAIFAADPVLAVNCDLLVAFSQATGRLERARDDLDAELRALRLAMAGNGEAWIIKGGIGMRSGRWLYMGEPQRVVATKVDSPNSRRGFAAIVERLRKRLDGFAGAAERDALDSILDSIAVDWPNLSAAEIDAIIGGAAETMGAIGANSRLITAARGAMSSTAVNVANNVRAAVAQRFRLPIRQSFTLQDLRAIRRLGGGRVGFFTDEYGRRSSLFDRDARRIVNRGLAQGLDRREMAGDLSRLAVTRATGRSNFYYQVVAQSLVSSARSFSQLGSYRDAGIVAYEWESVMDRRTCPICRFLHGQRFPVDTGLQRFAEADRLAATDVEAAANVTPWYSVVPQEEGPDLIMIRPRGEGPTVPVAEVVRSGVGRADDRGAFRSLAGITESGGSQTPPAHGGCRCTTVPVID